MFVIDLFLFCYETATTTKWREKKVIFSLIAINFLNLILILLWLTKLSCWMACLHFKVEKKNLKQINFCGCLFWAQYMPCTETVKTEKLEDFRRTLMSCGWIAKTFSVSNSAVYYWPISIPDTCNTFKISLYTFDSIE